MIVKQFGNPNNPAVMLIHGGGLSWWMWQPQIKALEQEYHLLVPMLDGHGEAAGTDFLSIEDSAQKIIAFIEQSCGGRLFALCGLSIGAQITVEILSQKPNIAQKAVIESALVLPMGLGKGMDHLLSLSYPLIRKRWFARLQARQMYVPDELFEQYFADSARMSKQSLLNMTVSNVRYTLPAAFGATTAEVAVLCGAKEYGIMRRSAQLLCDSVPGAILRVVPDCGHGVSVKYPERYIRFLKLILENKLEAITLEQTI